MRGEGIEGTDGGNGWEAAGRPDAVVVGLDPQIDYLRLTVATDCVRAGARFIATNRDPVYPTERGLRPGAGSIVAAVEAASGVTPISIGKPEPLPARGGGPRRRPRRDRGDHDRRRADDRHRRGAGGRRAEHPDADRRHDVGAEPSERRARRPAPEPAVAADALSRAGRRSSPMVVPRSAA